MYKQKEYILAIAAFQKAEVVKRLPVGQPSAHYRTQTEQAAPPTVWPVRASKRRAQVAWLNAAHAWEAKKCLPLRGGE